MGLKQRFFIFSAVFLLLVAAFYAIVESQKNELTKIRKRIEEDWKETRIVFELQAGLSTLDSEFERRGASAEFAALQATLSHMRERTKKLSSLAHKDLIGIDSEKDEQRALAALSESLERWDALLADAVASKLSEVELRTQADELYDQTTQAIAAYSHSSLAELDHSLGALDNSEELMSRLSRQFVIGLTGLLIFAWFGLSFWLLRPVASLSQLTKRVRDRDFSMQRIPHGPDEIGDLVESFIDMSRAVESFTAELEEKVRERTEALEASQGRLRQMLDNLPDAVGLSREDGTMLHANATYRSMFGSSEMSPVATIRATQPTTEGFYEWTDREGHERLLAIQSHVLRAGDPSKGAVTLEHVRDMTVQIETQTALAASQKLAAIGRLSSGLAHEINNPLTAIGACAEGLLKRQQAGNFDADVSAEYLRTIYDEVFRCKEITEKLLDFSRRQESRIERIDIGEVLADVVRLTLPLATRAGVTIEFVNCPAPTAFTDAAAIRQIALNLIINAIEASNSGGQVRVALEGDDETVTLQVSDNGVGFDSQDATKLLEPFYTRRRDGSGTGLGLFVCHELAQVLGGSIQPFSDGPGRGSTFTLVLSRRIVPALVPSSELEDGESLG